MKYLVALLLSLAAGFGTFILGAVIWSALDPSGAGRAFLFTIPVAIVCMVVLGLLGMTAMMTGHFDWSRQETFKPVAEAPVRPKVRKAPAQRPFPAAYPDAGIPDDAELALVAA
jgi:hypothetical protein